MTVTHKFFSMCLFLFITLYMFRAHSAHHQERQIVSIQPLVTVILCWWPRCVQVGRRLWGVWPRCVQVGRRLWGVFFQPAHISATNTEWQSPEAVLIQFVSPDDEHCVLETCRELEKNLCITLVIYQEHFHSWVWATVFNYSLHHSCNSCPY